MDREKKVKKFAAILSKTRYQSKLSQERIADALGVSKRTIAHWESGKSIPNFVQCVDWFETVGVNPFVTMIKYFYPEEMKVTALSDDREVDVALRKTIDILSPDDKRALLYLFYGNHGSSARSVLQLVLAYLHTPLKDRIPQAAGVARTYDLDKRLGTLICQQNVMPKEDMLHNAIDQAMIAVIEGKYAYTNDMEKDTQ